MKLVHSLWSKPLQEANPVNRQKTTVTMLWCYAMSVAFAKMHNLPIRLYADDYAADLLSFLPYDEIYPLQVPEGTPSIFWAAGKFSAYAQMNPGDLHIDGDVFLQTPAVVHLLKYASYKYDLLVQCVEDESNCNSEAYDIVNDLLNVSGIKYGDFLFPKFKCAYNTGLIGFNDMALRDEYVRLYFDAMEQIQSNPKLINKLNEASSAPDIVLEQQQLYMIAREKNVYSLLGSGEFSMKYSGCIGYQHLLGDAKQSWLHKTIEQLHSVDPELFWQTEQAVNSLFV